VELLQFWTLLRNGNFFLSEIDENNLSPRL
jgi:hypothetical protein